MMKSYHYFYALDDFNQEYSGLIELENCFPDEEIFYRYLAHYLDQQSYNIRTSVVSRLIDFAGKEIGRR